jgi:hypothetical protein
VSSSANNANQESRQNSQQSPWQNPWQGAWPTIVRIIILEIAVLLALAGALVYYLNWSSEAALSEFMAKSGASLEAVRSLERCDRRA